MALASTVYLCRQPAINHAINCPVFGGMKTEGKSVSSLEVTVQSLEGICAL